MRSDRGAAISKLRSAVVAAGLAMVSIAVAAAESAGAWPQRTVHLIVPFASGSGPDVAARLYAERLTLRWKRAVVVENRTGAEGLVGVTAFAGMKDDHALLFSPAAPISVFPFTHEKLAYDPARDLVPICLAIDTFGAIAVPASLAVGSLAELVALGHAHPGTLNWTSGGGAFPTLLAGFAKTAGLDVVQISYRDQTMAIQDLAEGRVQFVATTLTALLALQRSGKIRILAVTNKRRAPFAPAVPTVAEAGHPELEFDGLAGFFGTRDMTGVLREAISGDVRAVGADPVLVERLAAVGQLVRASTPAEFAAAIDEQRSRIESIVRLIVGQR